MILRQRSHAYKVSKKEKVLKSHHNEVQQQEYPAVILENNFETSHDDRLNNTHNKNMTPNYTTNMNNLNNNSPARKKCPASSSSTSSTPTSSSKGHPSSKNFLLPLLRPRTHSEAIRSKSLKASSAKHTRLRNAKNNPSGDNAGASQNEIYSNPVSFDSDNGSLTEIKHSTSATSLSTYTRKEPVPLRSFSVTGTLKTKVCSGEDGAPVVLISPSPSSSSLNMSMFSEAASTSTTTTTPTTPIATTIVTTATTTSTANTTPGANSIMFSTTISPISSSSTIRSSVSLTLSSSIPSSPSPQLAHTSSASSLCSTSLDGVLDNMNANPEESEPAIQKKVSSSLSAPNSLSNVVVNQVQTSDNDNNKARTFSDILNRKKTKHSQHHSNSSNGSNNNYNNSSNSNSPNNTSTSTTNNNHNHVKPKKLKELKDSELRNFSHRMAKCIQSLERTQGTEVYLKCFVGSEACCWMISNENVSRVNCTAEAITLGQRLISAGCVENINNNTFKNTTKAYYRFTHFDLSVIASPDKPRDRGYSLGQIVINSSIINAHYIGSNDDNNNNNNNNNGSHNNNHHGHSPSPSHSHSYGHSHSNSDPIKRNSSSASKHSTFSNKSAHSTSSSESAGPHIHNSNSSSSKDNNNHHKTKTNNNINNNYSNNHNINNSNSSTTSHNQNNNDLACISEGHSDGDDAIVSLDDILMMSPSISPLLTTTSSPPPSSSTKKSHHTSASSLKRLTTKAAKHQTVVDPRDLRRRLQVIVNHEHVVLTFATQSLLKDIIYKCQTDSTVGPLIKDANSVRITTVYGRVLPLTSLIGDVFKNDDLAFIDTGVPFF